MVFTKQKKIKIFLLLTIFYCTMFLFFFSFIIEGAWRERKKCKNKYSPLSRLSKNSAASIRTAILIFT